MTKDVRVPVQKNNNLKTVSKLIRVPVNIEDMVGPS